MLRRDVPTLKAVVFVLSGVVACSAIAQDTFVLKEMSSDTSLGSRPYGINATGQIVGLTMQNATTAHAAQWLNDEYVDLQQTSHFELGLVFNLGYSEAYDISDGGQVVGTARKEVDCDPVTIQVTTAMLLRPAVLSDLGTPFAGDALMDLATLGNPCSAFNSAATGVSNNSHVVGWADLGGGEIHAFLVTPVDGTWFVDADMDGVNDLMIDLGTLPNAVESSATDVNDSGVVVGWSYNGGVYHAFRVVPSGGLWEQDLDADSANDLMEDLGTLGGSNSWARGINTSGQIVGESVTSGRNTRAFLWQSGTMTDLGTLGGANSSAAAINDDGVIVGWAEDSSRVRRAVYWDTSGKIFNLNSRLVANANPSITLNEARDINESGEIAGWGRVIGGTAKEKPFMLRVATSAEVTAAEAEVAAATATDTTGSTVVSGATSDTTTSGDGFTGTPLIDGSSTTTDTTGGTTTETMPALCGTGAVGMMPLTLLGMVAMRRRRQI